MKYLTKSSVNQLMFYRCYHVPSTMKCFQLNNYAPSLTQLDVSHTCKTPDSVDLLPTQALVKVKAASINPFDVEMTRGYGKNAINLFRNLKKSSEFPLILGRDCSGVIVKRGKRFRRYQLNEPVSCVRWIVGQGTHAEYVIVNKDEVSKKPENLSFVEAASLPYVACTTWSALINTGAVSTNYKHKQKIFIPGGTGGIGSFAVQLCKILGHEVFTSCSTNGVQILQSIGIENIIDYTASSYEQDLLHAGPFDVILDTLNEQYVNLFKKQLKNDNSSRYVSLRPTLLPDTDQKGLLMGLAQSGKNFLSSNISQFSSNKGVYQWGFFTPNALVLDRVRPHIEDGRIKPLVDKVYLMDDILKAYEYVQNGHARGKTVVDMESS